MSNLNAGTAVAFNTSSDYRLKENIDYTWDATTRLKQLKPARFNWIKDETNTLEDGFIAHEVSSVVSNAVSGDKDETVSHSGGVVTSATGRLVEASVLKATWEQGKIDGIYDSDTTWSSTKSFPKYQQIDYSKLVPLLVKTIQELEARITALES